MKNSSTTSVKLFSAFIIMLLSICLYQCKKDDEVNPNANDSTELPSQNILVDDGSVGLVIDTRAIARKGYKPAIATISFPGGLSSFSKELTVNSYTSVATLKISADDLTKEQHNQFVNGIDVTIKITDGSDTELATFTGNVAIDSSNKPVEMDTEMPAIYPDLNINENTPYLLQAITDSEVKNLLLKLRVDAAYEPGLDAIVFAPYDQSLNSETTGKFLYSFYFESINDSTYYIKMQPAQGGATYYLRISPPGNFYCYYAQTPEDADYYKFVVKRDAEGLIKIKPLSGNPISNRKTTYDTQASYASSPDQYVPFRMVAGNIEWSVSDQGTEYNDPVLPPAKLDFAYQSVLKNCSSATLTETVGKSETQTTSYTVGTEESLELFSSHEASVEVSAGVETESKFFGSGATVSLDVTAGYSYTTSETKTTSNTFEQTNEKSEEVSRVRDVEIPPFKAVEVFDAIQTLENVKIPFVQKLQVKGKYDGTTQLTGDEIASQLLANQFEGVVSEIQSGYVVITVKGTATINNFFKTESEVNELKGYCDNN